MPANVATSPHASELTFRQIRVGDTYQTEHAFSAEDVTRYAQLCGDLSPLHVDEAYAAATPFGGRVVHGMLLASIFSQLVGMRIPGKHALYLGQDLAFRIPVRVGETLTATAKVTAKSVPTRTITLATEIRNALGKVAVSGSAKVKVRDAEPAEDGVVETAQRAVGRKVALVTGASRGIGAEIARTLGHRGIAVAVNYFRSAENARRVVDAIQQGGGTAVALQADVRERDEVRRLVEGTVENLGGVDMVVNSATAELQQRGFVDLPWEAFQTHLDFQVKAVVEVCQAAYPYLKARHGGAIVNVLSQVVSGPPPALMADYVTAKHALKGLSKALATEWAADNIRVNMISPGLTQTELTEHYHERVFKMEASRTPLRRLVRPADIANAVAYLLGDEAAFLTGVDLSLTGGQVMA